MRLQVNEEKSGVRTPDEVQFLGFRFRCARGEEGDSRRLSLRQSRATAEGNHAGDDASELGAIHHVLHGRGQPIPDRVDVAFPALHAGGGPGLGVHRRPRPPPDQGDHRSTEEAASLPLPTPEGQRRQRKGCRQLCVLRQGSMGEVKPPRDAEGLSSVMVRRSDGLAQSDVDKVLTHRRYRPSSCWSSERSIQRAGCVARMSGSVRGAKEQSFVPTRQVQPLCGGGNFMRRPRGVAG